jgi:hypothetical protein
MHQIRESLLVAGASPLDEVSIHLTLGVRRGSMASVYP